MKIQHLSIIFILIFLPLILVLSRYMQVQIDIIKTEEEYDSRLFESSYDSVKAFQLNTINTAYYVPETRIQNIEAGVKTFFNSLVTSFKYDGYDSKVMNEYIPAVVLSLYDGYYIYSPHTNFLTNVDMDEVDDEFKDPVMSGLKPFISYTCKYIDNNKDKTYFITYSLDNYILVDIYDNTTGEREVSRGGYLISGIDERNEAHGSGKYYVYDGIEFHENDYEKMNENITILVGNLGASKDRYYANVNGTKYYYNDNGTPSTDEDDYIFYIDNSKQEKKQVTSKKNNEEMFNYYYNKIFSNNSAYCYYRDAYIFTKWITGGSSENVTFYGERNPVGCQDLTTLRIDKIDNNVNYANYDFYDVGDIFDLGNSQHHIEDADSHFNQHRKDVIRAVISTNLSTAISGFSKYSSANVEYKMPKISEDDWELLENNICIATFMQGMKVGGKTYNSYAVIPNNLNKEYVDENDIYLLTEDKTYVKSNDTSVLNPVGGIRIEDKGVHEYYPGVLKINLEPRKYSDSKYYNAISYANGAANRRLPYLASYTSIAGSTGISSIVTSDLYRYMRNEVPNTEDGNKIKETYYKALGRERYQSFKYTRNYTDNINYINTTTTHTETIDVDIVFVVDHSGSMRSQVSGTSTRIQKVYDAIAGTESGQKGIIDRIDENTDNVNVNYGIVFFEGSARSHSGTTFFDSVIGKKLVTGDKIKEAIKNRFSHMNPEGSTPTSDGLEEAQKILSNDENDGVENHKRIIILLTDGVPYPASYKTSTKTKVTEIANAGEIKLITMLTGGEDQSTAEALFLRKNGENDLTVLYNIEDENIQTVIEENILANVLYEIKEVQSKEAWGTVEWNT